MTDITTSVTLPSLHPGALERTLRNIRDATKLPHQVIIVSPFRPPDIVARHGALTWIHERDPAGCNAAHAVALGAAMGQYVTPWVDDHLYADGWDVAAVAAHRDGERAFMLSPAWTGSGPFVLGLRQVWPQQVGTCFGLYYPYFPFLRAVDARHLGWFDRVYRMDFADCDLGMRVWQARGRAEWAEHPTVVVHEDDRRKDGRAVCAPDMALFISRWAPVFGHGWSTADLRDFNIDLDLFDRRWIDDRVRIDGWTALPSGLTRSSKCG